MITTARGQRGLYTIDPATRRAGGQAEVYRVTDAEGRRFALKIAHGAGREGSRLERERALLEALLARQPGAAGWVVAPRDHGRAPDGRPFMILPWFERTLQSWIERDAPPLERRLLALEQAIAAVIRLHRSPEDLGAVLLHRDIKPANLLVDAGEPLSVVLADLGIGRRGRLLSARAHTGTHTPWFAPPEQQLPLAASPDPSVDVHALAVTIYWALTEQIPQSALSRESCLTRPAFALTQLAARGDRRSAAERSEFERLQREPLAAFFDLERAESLGEGDVNALRFALEGQLRDRAREPVALAERLCDLLAPALERALAPDPALRERDPRILLVVCQRCREEMGRQPAIGGASSRPARRSGSTHPRAALAATTALRAGPATLSPTVLPATLSPAETTPDAPGAPASEPRRARWAGWLLLGLAAPIGWWALQPGAPSTQRAAQPPDGAATEPADEPAIASGFAAPPLDEPGGAEPSDEPPPEVEDAGDASGPPPAAPSGAEPIVDPPAESAPPPSLAEPASAPEPAPAPLEPPRIWFSLVGDAPFTVHLNDTPQGSTVPLPPGEHELKVRPRGDHPCRWSVLVAPLDASAWSLEIADVGVPNGKTWSRTVAAGGVMKARCNLRRMGVLED